MPHLQSMSGPELNALLRELEGRYDGFRAQALDLNMTRGRPCPEQLDLSLEMLRCVGPDDYAADDGTDCRNYGVLAGLPEARALMAAILGIRPEQTICAGNSSLTLIHDVVADAMTHGVPGGPGPWRDSPPVRFICPVPGYDRHFTIMAHYGIEMWPVRTGPDGPDMDAVERLAADPAVRGMICVPRYSNPTGVTFSDEVVDRLAAMATGAADFRLLWDNAYAVHHLTDTPDELKDVLAACADAGYPDRAIVFGSTSKVTFAGSGLAAVAGSEANFEDILSHMRVRTIGPDKLNQLRHVRFLRDMDGVRDLMRRHAAILRPKFHAVDSVLDEEIGDTGAATWSRPNGGYFVSLNVAPGCAAAVVQMAADLGVRLTPAGATFPNRHDPDDRNVRIAPTLPSLDEIERAMRVVAVCALLAAVRKRLGA